MAHQSPVRSVVVYGPAYLDRVLRVDDRLTPEGMGGPLDHSVDAEALDPGSGLTFIDRSGNTIEVLPPPGWPGPLGSVRLAVELGLLEGKAWLHRVSGKDWQDDLGGMGAGYAAALGGLLVSALGPAGDPTSVAVTRLLERAGIEHRPVLQPDQRADWTMMVSSGRRGDKLPIGFRGCHEGWSHAPFGVELVVPSRLRVVAALPNRLAAFLLRSAGSQLRFFAPSRRNMAGSAADPPIVEFADAIDLLSCNLGEWQALPPAEAEAIQRSVPVVVVTDGARGAMVRFHTRVSPELIHIPAFPRRRPPRDTNRAGEAFASTMLSGLSEAGWQRGPIVDLAIERLAWRASAAASLVLDRLDFGFPSADRIDAALAAGVVR